MEKLRLIGSKTIETEHFILRTFKESDGEYMYKNWASSPQVAKYVRWECHASPQVSNEICKSWEESGKDPDFFHWAMELKEISEPIGSIGAVGLDLKKATAEIGYCMGEKWWNKGYMTECLKAVIDYLFGEVGLNEITACHAVLNPASGKVMEKSGMEFSHNDIYISENENNAIYHVKYYNITADKWCEMQRK